MAWGTANGSGNVAVTSTALVKCRGQRWQLLGQGTKGTCGTAEPSGEHWRDASRKEGMVAGCNHGVTEVLRPARFSDPPFLPPQPHTSIKKELLCWQNEEHGGLPYSHIVLWPPSPCPTAPTLAH